MMVLTLPEFRMLRDYVCEVTGIFFAEQKQALLQKRLQNRVAELGLASFEDYYYFLRYGDKEKQELANLFEVVTTNETSFFRHSRQLEKFIAMIGEQVLQTREPREPLRIWSAGCSTGEEAYTLSIMLLEMAESLGRPIPYRIFGTDLSRNVLASAKRGVYGAHSVRHAKPSLIEKYFERDQGRFVVGPAARQNVVFDQMNLNDIDSYRKYKYMDAILCRNVLIYFGEDVKRKVVEALHECLKPGGCLALGNTESLYHVSMLLKPVLSPGALVYRKEGV